MGVQLVNGLTKESGDRITNINVRQILILNLMPNHAQTEQQWANILDQADMNIAITFLRPATHQFKQHEQELCERYVTLTAIQDKQYDALIVTGAPLEKVMIEDIDFWSELKIILAWSKMHVKESLFVCWGVYAAGLLDNDFEVKRLKEKVFGVFTSQGYRMPHSRYFMVPVKQKLAQNIEVVAEEKSIGITIMQDHDKHRTYITGHYEYGTHMLEMELYRDKRQGLKTLEPQNYFNDWHRPINNWREEGRLFYRNWLLNMDDMI